MRQRQHTEGLRPAGVPPPEIADLLRTGDRAIGRAANSARGGGRAVVNECRELRERLHYYRGLRV